eukprot:scaffold15582_cov66-Phaeocystis_antarctica.AAC.1
MMTATTTAAAPGTARRKPRPVSDLRVSSSSSGFFSSTISAFWKNDFFTAFLTCLPFFVFVGAASSSLLKKPNCATAGELRAATLRRECECKAPGPATRASDAVSASRTMLIALEDLSKIADESETC